MTTEGSLSPETVLAEMKKNGITHVVWLPDSETNWLYLLMKAEPSITLVAVPREGLAYSAAAGIYIGGGTPVILIQNTGMMESGDSLRGWALGMNIPVVLMVGLRGWTRHGVTQDTAAVYTEPFLNELRAYGPTRVPPVTPDVIAGTTYFGNGIQDWAELKATHAPCKPGQ